MIQPLNILMLGGAKRVSMSRLFKAAAERLEFDLNLYSFELEKDVPVASVADVIVGGKWTDDTILDQLDRVLNEKNIDIIIPFVDGSIEVAANYCKLNPMAWSPVSSAEVCRSMFDKLTADDLLRAAGIPLPRIVTGGKPSFYPVIAKPRTGSASKGIKIIENEKEWDYFNLDTGKYIIQEYIANRNEYTLDCYVDHTGHITAISPRLRIDVLGGEVIRTRTVNLPEGVEMARQAIDAVGLRGAVTVQLIEDLDTGRLMLMEINPRLGGGAVCSVYAGVDIPAMIINDWQCHYIEFADPKPDIEMVRYMQEVIFDAGNRVVEG